MGRCMDGCRSSMIRNPERNGCHFQSVKLTGDVTKNKHAKEHVCVQNRDRYE